MPVDCEHGATCHDGTESSVASAPEGSRAWLLIEHPGPWPAEAADAELPEPLRPMVAAAVAHKIRVQLIRKPGRREAPSDRRAVLAGCVASNDPWLRRGTAAPGLDLDVAALARGEPIAFGVPVADPLFLVCVHGKRNVCCARFGVPLAQSLAGRYPGQVWETTHVSGHRYAANLVILPHGLYYGPVNVALATAAIDAYRAGAISSVRYRGRAGQPRDIQKAEYDRLVSTTAPASDLVRTRPEDDLDCSRERPEGQLTYGELDRRLRQPSASNRQV